MASPAPARPDPDQLLAQLRSAEARQRRGRLRIYFGANAGVGKTYAMLSAAQRERKAGRDVVVGVVETHGRAETAELLTGLEQLPQRQVEYRGNALREFDLDAALARHPAVLLVDELAHTNVEGSRHPKRWQDVQELLDAGIDVWSALNVQHLESLNGTVGAITQIRVHETVPDTVLDQADEVVLVDVTPDELLARLKAGKVYLPQQAERAAQNFFRIGNLVALREIALRRTAEHVEDEARDHRVERSGETGGAPPLWKTSGAILVAVGPRSGAEQVVRDCARLAGKMNVRWHAAYVETPRLQMLAAPERERILSVLKLAEELGGGTAVLTGSDVAAELVAQAQVLNCATLMLGRSAEPQGWELWKRGRRPLVRQLARLAPALDILEVGQADTARKLAPALRQPQDEAEDAIAWHEGWPGYAWAVGAAVAVTLLATPLIGRLDLTNIVMLFLAAVVWVALRFGRGPAALAACLNVAAFDFFFVQPRFAFAVSDAQYLLTFAVMLTVGLLIGQLTAGVRFSARISASRERRAQALFELTRELSAALVTEQVRELGQNAVQALFGGAGGGAKGGAALILVANDGVGGQTGLAFPKLLPHDMDTSVADWVFRNGQSAGLATNTLPSHPWHYVPLKAPMRVRGVLALKPAQARWLLIPEQQQLLQTLARQIAIALERVHYVEVAQNAVVQIESERLRNALLAAISHDVRTPLTAILGLAESLQASSPAMPPAQAEMTGAISTQARQLNALVTNLLDMARLQEGAVHLRSEWQSVQEVVGTALRAARHAIAGMAVQTDIPPDLPLVEFDASLMERVLVNLLENAAKYGAAPIEVRARTTDDALVLTVRDHGPGLPASVKGREAQLFEKFTRGQAESATPGVGLGLAICKAIVDAHRGQITAANAADGGAEFSITLPRRPPPEV